MRDLKNQKEAERIFKKANENMPLEAMYFWLCFVYGYMETKMGERDRKDIEEELDRRLKSIKENK